MATAGKKLLLNVAGGRTMVCWGLQQLHVLNLGLQPLHVLNLHGSSRDHSRNNLEQNTCSALVEKKAQQSFLESPQHVTSGRSVVHDCA
jgi:hypothetical protein